MIWLEVHYDKTGYMTKPTKNEISIINSRIIKNRKKLSIDVLADLVGNKGKAFTAALFNGKRKEEYFTGQQLYVLDFDNDRSEAECLKYHMEYILTPEACLERCRVLGLRPSFMYHSLRSTPDHPKFRLVFVNDVEIQNINVTKAMTRMLMYLFPEADPLCKDVARMYLGGKGLLMCDSDAVINIHQIAVLYQKKMKMEDAAHYTRKLVSNAHKMGIEVKNNLLCIYQLDIEDNDLISDHENIFLNGENRAKPLIYISGKSLISPLFYKIILYKNKSCHCTEEKTKQDPVKTERLSDTKNTIMNTCELFRDFISDADSLTHEQKCVIASSLVYIRGTKKLFMDSLKDHWKEWEYEWEYFRKSNYHPWRCNPERCSYYDRCKGPTLYSRLTDRRIEILKPPGPYVTEGEAYQELVRALNTVYADKEKSINIIIAQTGIGKTEAYCNLVAEKILNSTADKPFLIAVPTHNLQNEIANRLRNKGISVLVTQNLADKIKDNGVDDLSDMIQDLYWKGLGSKVKKIIKSYMNEDGLPLGTKDLLSNILNKHEAIQDMLKSAEHCVVTTHALLLEMSAQTLEKYEIIIDEDILLNVFKNIYTIPIRYAQKAVSDGLLPQSSEFEKIIRAEHGTIHRTFTGKYPKEKLDELYSVNDSLQANIPALYEAGSIYVQKDTTGEYLHYFLPKKLAYVKMTILSATANPDLYRRYCRNHHINHISISEVKYKGKLEQYYAHSLSRTDINMIGFSKLKRSVNSVTEEPDINTITFKSNTSPGGRIYFGASSGLDILSGKDLAVIGTPHLPEFIYKLLGKWLGFDTSECMRPQVIEDGRYRFRLHTFSDSGLRSIQLYLIRSELEQAVGRARLLRNDCTVYLFSNFPLDQAELHNEEYLLETSESDQAV